MKVVLSFKTPDVLDDAIEDLSPKEQTMVKRVARKFVEFDEYVYIEIDTDTGTAIVLPAWIENKKMNADWSDTIKGLFLIKNENKRGEKQNIVIIVEDQWHGVTVVKCIRVIVVKIMVLVCVRNIIAV